MISYEVSPRQGSSNVSLFSSYPFCSSNFFVTIQLMPARNQNKSVSKPKTPCTSTYGFTLVEIMIVVTLIAIIATVGLMNNVSNSLQKGRDGKRKQDLSKLVRVLEDYYNDNNHFPYYDPSTGIIAGSPWGEPFGSYVPQLPADPSAPSQQYYYLSGESGNPNFFVLYARLENKTDDDIALTGCSSGCGPNLSYNYAIHSSNVIMVAGLPTGPEVNIAYQADNPTPTAVPPTPTLILTPPASGPCSHNQCCQNRWCGQVGYPGSSCGNGQKCLNTPYDPLNPWQCSCVQACGGNPQCPES